MYDRPLIDPEHRYPAEGLRAVERHALKVIDLLPGAAVTRTRDAIQVEHGGETGIVLLVTPEALELRLPTVEWTQGACGPEAASRLWKRVEWEQVTDDDLPDLLAGAREARRAEFVPCRFCGKRTPPEHRVEDDVCHGCAERRLGIVF